jgi:catechol 2,3-dioxygenase-like lactoylglutathione lyase family enzyme
MKQPKEQAMNNTGSLGGPARSVLVRVSDLDVAGDFYANGLGLSRVGEAEAITDSARELWRMPDGNLRCARFAKPGDPFGMIELIEWAGGSDETIRDPRAAFDYGWLSLNHKTSEMARGLAHLAKYGATAVSDAKHYEAGGKQIAETMVDLATGERCTILQVGEALDRPHPFGESVATVGVVVESVEASLPFYRDALGLNVVLTIDHKGEPFSTLVGAPPDTHLKMALLASSETWTGKLELLQFTLPEGSAVVRDANPRADGRHNGYWMVGITTPDLDAFAAAATAAGASIVRGPMAVDRPFVGATRAMIVRAPGGECFECTAV